MTNNSRFDLETYEDVYEKNKGFLYVFICAAIGFFGALCLLTLFATPANSATVTFKDTPGAHENVWITDDFTIVVNDTGNVYPADNLFGPAFTIDITANYQDDSLGEVYDAWVAYTAADGEMIIGDLRLYMPRYDVDSCATLVGGGAGFRGPDPTFIFRADSLCTYNGDFTTVTVFGNGVLPGSPVDPVITDPVVTPPAPVPLPAGLPLLFAALGGLSFAAYRKQVK